MTTVPSADETAAFFDAIASRYDRLYGLETGVRRERMAPLLAQLGTAPREILDLGVGTGLELPFLLDAGHHVTGVDISREMTAICARRARPIPIVTADIWSPLPFADASFDCVIALHGTLAHPPENARVEDLAREIHRLLRPSGFFFAEVPARAWDGYVHEDESTHASLLARTFDRDAWTHVPFFSTSVETVSDELRIVWTR